MLVDQVPSVCINIFLYRVNYTYLKVQYVCTKHNTKSLYKTNPTTYAPPKSIYHQTLFFQNLSISLTVRVISFSRVLSLYALHLV